MPTGRPSTHTPELGQAILDRLAQGESLTEICRGKAMPHRVTVLRWMEKDPAFRNAYAHARELCGDAAAERAVREGLAATPENAQAARVRFDALRWWASKLAPKVYGEKIQNEHSGSVGVQQQTADRLGGGLVAMNMAAF